MKFVHPAEALVASVLDYFGIRWQYEPHTFILSVDDEGATTYGFTPDFYLPDLCRYIEVTTSQSKYCRRKRRKIDDVREKYGAVIKLVTTEQLLGMVELLGIDYGEIRPAARNAS